MRVRQGDPDAPWIRIYTDEGRDAERLDEPSCELPRRMRRKTIAADDDARVRVVPSRFDQSERNGLFLDNEDECSFRFKNFHIFGESGYGSSTPTDL